MLFAAMHFVSYWHLVDIDFVRSHVHLWGKPDVADL
jgi:hypothetical protein